MTRATLYNLYLNYTNIPRIKRITVGKKTTVRLYYRILYLDIIQLSFDSYLVKAI